MFTAVIAVAALLQGQGQSRAGALVSKMLSHYYSANTISGNMTYQQSAVDPIQNQKFAIHGSTKVQIERPNKLFIVQTSDLPGAGNGRIVSNGQRFLYNVPQDTRELTRTLGSDSQLSGQLIEDVVQFDYNSQTKNILDVAQIYTVGSAGLPLHPAAPLDIAISRHDALKAFSDQLASVSDQGTSTINGKSAHIVTGDWRQYVDAPVSGTYQLAITDDGDLLQYILNEQVEPAGADSRGGVVRMAQSISVTTTWNVDLAVNGPVDEKLFNDRALVTPRYSGFNPPKPHQPPN